MTNLLFNEAHFHFIVEHAAVRALRLPSRSESHPLCIILVLNRWLLSHLDSLQCSYRDIRGVHESIFLTQTGDIEAGFSCPTQIHLASHEGRGDRLCLVMMEDVSLGKVLKAGLVRS